MHPHLSLPPAPHRTALLTRDCVCVCACSCAGARPVLQQPLRLCAEAGARVQHDQGLHHVQLVRDAERRRGRQAGGRYADDVLRGTVSSRNASAACTTRRSSLSTFRYAGAGARRRWPADDVRQPSADSARRPAHSARLPEQAPRRSRLVLLRVCRPYGGVAARSSAGPAEARPARLRRRRARAQPHQQQDHELVCDFLVEHFRKPESNTIAPFDK